MSEIHVYPSGRIRWTDEMNDYMREIVPGHTRDQIRELFCQRYGVEISDQAIHSRCRILNVKSGVNSGRFQSGFRKPKKTEVHPMDVPYSQRPLGEERVNHNGMVEVHVSHRVRKKKGDCWKLKSHIVWEEAHGTPVPDGHCIVFADRNARNFSPENLVAVPRKLWSTINYNQIPYHDAESLQIAIDIAQIKSGIVEVMKRPRPCKTCGKTFKPRFTKQKNCDSCIGH